MKTLLALIFLSSVSAVTPFIAVAQAQPALNKVVVQPPISRLPDAGARAFLQCRSCHTLARGQADMVGPNLAGFMGTRAGSHRPGFVYSPALRASTLVWNDATLDRWLENPAATIPGTTMAFIGMKKPETRAALIAYLKRETR